MPSTATDRPRHRPRAAIVSLAGIAGLAAVALPGCNTPGGGGWSHDRFTYESTPWQPWTVNLVDTRTQETIWTAEVPPGQQLVLAFRRGSGESPEYPDLMTWEITPAGRLFGAQSNRLPVPPASARLLKPTLRPAPEFPQAQRAIPVPPPMPPVAPPEAKPDEQPTPPTQGETAKPPN